MKFLAARFSSTDSALARLADFAAQLVDGKVTGVDCVVWGSLLLGVTCGVLGCFIVLRRQSLLGDAIGHAVLPGVCVGFFFAGTRATPALLVGAMVSGLLAAALISLLQRTTVLKTAECMGVVFTGFYGVGIVLLKMLQTSGRSGQAGLDKFLFGQIVGISLTDVAYMTVVSGLSLALVVGLWRTLAVSTFDEGFARSVGLPVRVIHYLLVGLLTVAIVISIQAVGVVLVSAMLVTPAATAYLLTDRLHRMAILAGAFGAAAGLAGAALSLLGPDLPTGAFMVLAASGLFAAAFALSPRHGVVPRAIRVWRRQRRTRAENLLRTLYVLGERRGDWGRERRFGVTDVAAVRHESPAQVRRFAALAAANGWVDAASPDPIVLTDAGVAEASRVVRNHRLWELFLTQEANLAADHVHADAERIEHVLPPDVLRRLEQMLDRPTTDPHGRPIPA